MTTHPSTVARRIPGSPSRPMSHRTVSSSLAGVFPWKTNTIRVFDSLD